MTSHIYKKLRWVCVKVRIKSENITFLQLLRKKKGGGDLFQNPKKWNPDYIGQNILMKVMAKKKYCFVNGDNDEEDILCD
jgi:hypothetical protein